MALEGWVDPKSHYTATGEVSGDRMTDATVDDTNGTTIDRNLTFESKEDFFTWARQRAGISW